MSSKLTITYNGSTLVSDYVDSHTNVPITYNGSTLATVSAGSSKTMSTSGKIMSSNLVIGDKTLTCNGKLMSGNVGMTVKADTTTVKFNSEAMAAYSTYKGFHVFSKKGYAGDRFITNVIYNGDTYSTLGTTFNIIKGSTISFLTTYDDDTFSGHAGRHIYYNSSQVSSVDMGDGKSLSVQTDYTVPSTISTLTIDLKWSMSRSQGMYYGSIYCTGS